MLGLGIRFWWSVVAVLKYLSSRSLLLPSY
jgi:hypothetical protein